MNQKITHIVLCVLLLLLGLSDKIYAQTCSVNAGVSSSICASGTMTLSGNATGSLSGAANWALVSGPNTPTITSPASPSTTVTGFIPGTYVFRYYATCSDAAVVADSVTVTVNATPVGVTAGTDTLVCGNSCTLNGTLPVGTSGLWSYYLPPAPNGVNVASLGTPTSKNALLSLTSYNTTCPKTVNAIWTVTQGTCSARDTVTVQFRGQATLGNAVADITICGTSSGIPGFYYYGCGGNVAFAQLAGPTMATITGPAAAAGYGSGAFSNMSTGTYTFTATSTGACSGVFRDTFNITVGTTAALTTQSIASKFLCPQQFDSVYYFEPTVTLLPGETMTWNLNPSVYTPGATVIKPIADTIGNILRLRNVVHPDTNATSGFWNYIYSYTITNGTCSQTSSAGLQLLAPMGKKSFLPVVNLACGATSGNITIPTYGTNAGYTFANTSALVTPAGAPAPTIAASMGSGITASGLQPGKYIFKFEYYTYNRNCEMRTANVEVNVSAAAGLSNAGTDQLLACGVDSTTLAGNFPPAGQTGTWQLVSGPSGIVLTNPNSASLLVKNLLPGVYNLRWSIANGGTCPANADNMSVIVTPNAPTATAGPDRSVCYGYRTALNGNAVTIGTSGRWRQTGGPAVTIADSAAALTSFTGSVSGTTYTFTWTLSNTCGSHTDTVVITTGASQGPSDATITTPDMCLTTTSTTLTAIAPVSGSGFWSQLSGPGTATIATPASNSTTVSGLSGGEYKFIWQVTASGCDTLRDTISVAYRSATLTASAGPDRYICKDTIHLNAATPALGTGTWIQYGGPGTTIADLHNPVSGVSNLAGGSTYDYIWTVSLGVCPAAQDSVHIGISTPPSPAIARTDTLICGNTLGLSNIMSLPLTATVPAIGSGSWVFIKTPFYGGTIANMGAAVTTASLYAGVTQLLWQVTNGSCPATMDTVTFQIVPKADAGPASYNLCEGSSQSLQGTQPGNGTALWSQLSGPTTATITSPASPFTAINNLGTGTYKFRYDITNTSAAACSSFDTITITNSVKPLANAGRDSIFCYVPPGTVIYLQADTPALGTGAWLRTVGTGSLSYSPNANTNPARATVAAPGLHQFRWTVTNGGCTAIDYKDVSVEQLAVPAIAFSPVTVCKDSFSVSVASPYNNFRYAWAFQRARIRDTSGINLTGPIGNNFLVSDTNNIYLTITNPVTGCMAKDSSAIIVNCSYLPLPLLLLSFEAKANGTAVDLNWLTANERDIRLFHIERSADGGQWTRLGSIAAKGNTRQYAFSDQQPLRGINLYRLKIEELDGSYSYSPVKLVNTGTTGQQGILVYPNPASQQLNVILEGQTADNRYELVTIAGQVLFSNRLINGNTNSIDISGLASGLYILKVMTDGNTHTRQISIVR